MSLNSPGVVGVPLYALHGNPATPRDHAPAVAPVAAAPRRKAARPRGMTAVSVVWCDGTALEATAYSEHPTQAVIRAETLRAAQAREGLWHAS